MTNLNIQLDHIAIAVTDLNLIQKIYTDLGLSFPHPKEIINEQKVQVLMSPVQGPTNIEFLQSTSDDGPIGKFVQQKGPGIHHLCFRVKDIQDIHHVLSAKGYSFLYPQAKPGAHNCIVNFLHPKSTHGVLIEFSQHITTSI